MRKITLFDRLRYAFDNTLSRGPIALIAWLAGASAALILSVSAVAYLAHVAPGLSFLELAWMSLMRTLDAGTMGGDTGSWPFLLSMFAVTLGGVFVISTLIGVLTSGVEAQLDQLRKGRSRVIESGHIVILGWSAQIFVLLSELVEANANQPGGRIVVLAEGDKVEMEDAIRDHLPRTGRTRIICRTGSPTSMADLEIASLATSRAVIILSPETDDPDARVIKALLAVLKAPDRRPEPYHVVAEIRDPKNMEVARMISGGEAELLLVGDLIARIVAQSCRQSGLSVVYNELLDFAGDEIYFHPEPELNGKTFAQALSAYEDSTVIGLHPDGGEPRLNPPMETVIHPGDRLIVISEDDDTVRLSPRAAPEVAPEVLVEPRAQPAGPERTLILGWNWRAPLIARELDQYVAPGSELRIVADFPGGAPEADPAAQAVRQRVAVQPGDTTDRHTLDALVVEGYDHVIVLASSEARDVQQADARTLVTLLHLRDIANRTGKRFSIVSEMLDVRNRALAEVARADDFIVSDRIVSLLMAQIAETKALSPVFADLFDPQGSEIYLRRAGDYVRVGRAMDFYSVVEAARRRGEVAIGYRVASEAEDAGRAYGVVVNPDKSRPVTFAEGDRIIVLAES